MSALVGPLVPVVMLPRFTSYVGPGIYASAPMLVEDFDWGSLTFWRGPIVGGAATDPFRAWLQESNDLQDDLPGSVVSLAGTITLSTPPERFEFVLTKRWFRVKVQLSPDANGVVAVSLWLTGTLRRRVEGA